MLASTGVHRLTPTAAFLGLPERARPGVSATGSDRVDGARAHRRGQLSQPTRAAVHRAVAVGEPGAGRLLQPDRGALPSQEPSRVGRGDRRVRPVRGARRAGRPDLRRRWHRRPADARVPLPLDRQGPSPAGLDYRASRRRAHDHRRGGRNRQRPDRRCRRTSRPRRRRRRRCLGRRRGPWTQRCRRRRRSPADTAVSAPSAAGSRAVRRNLSRAEPTRAKTRAFTSTGAHCGPSRATTLSSKVSRGPPTSRSQ